MRRTATLLAAATLAIVTTPAAARAEPPPLAVAGADVVSIRLDRGALSLRVRDAGQAHRGEAGRSPAGVRLGGSTGTVPERGGFGFLGPPGTPVWVLGGSDGFLFWDTTGVPRGRFAGDRVALRLRAVEGPGRFHAYTVSSFGAPTRLLGSGDGAPRTMTLRAGARSGGALWAFDREGRYRVTLEASAGRLTTVATYQVDVPRIAPPPVRALKNTAPATGRKVVADGHVDMGPQLDGGTWRVRIRDDTGSPPVWRELSDVVIHAVDKARIKVPAGGDYAFLGPAGSDVWLLPQAQRSGIVWPGWNTQDPSVVGGTRGDVTWQLTTVDGPGEFKLFLTGSFGKPEVLFDSARRLPQQTSIPPNTHAHGNWAFTRAGVYHLGVRMSGTTTAGKGVSDTRTLHVAVGDVDPATAFDSGPPGEGASGGGSLPRTGSSWVLAAAGAGSLLLAAGAGLVAATRRRLDGR